MFNIIPWASTSSVPTNQLNDNFISQISAEIIVCETYLYFLPEKVQQFIRAGEYFLNP